MSRRKIKRNALNKGTAVHLGGPRVRFVWACGCTRVETMSNHGEPWSAAMTAKMVTYWRGSGIWLEQCRKHPDYYSKLSQVPRLNEEHPQNDC